MTQPEFAASRQRLAWLDYAKVIGIFLVVFAHASRSIERTPGLEWSASLQTLDGVIYAFHMPLFFMLAGFAAGLQRNDDTGSFARSLWWGVVVPYVIWSVIWIGLKVVLPGAANMPVEISALGKILWLPVDHFWFLYQLFFIRIGWYAMQRLAGAGTALLSAGIMAATGTSLLLSSQFPEFHWMAGFSKNFAIYGAGMVWLGAIVHRFGDVQSRNLVVLGGALCLWGLAIGGAPAAILYALGGALVVTGIAKLLPLPDKMGWRLFAFAGEASLAIYVMHLLVGAVARVGLTHAGLLSENTLLIGATITGLIVPAIIYWLVLSAASRSGQPLPRWLGLGPALRTAYLPLWPVAPAEQPVAIN